MARPSCSDDLTPWLKELNDSMIGPPTLWTWLSAAVQRDRLDEAIEGLHRYGLPRSPKDLSGLGVAMSDRLIRLLHDPSLDVNAMVSVPGTPSLRGIVCNSTTPLHWTVSHGQPRLRAWLLERGARLDLVNDLGQTVWDLLDHLRDLARRPRLTGPVPAAPGTMTRADLDRVAQGAEELQAELLAIEQGRLRAVIETPGMPRPRSSRDRHRL